MAKVNTGHAVNVENFNQVVINLKNMGSAWNPVDESLSIKSLEAHHADCLAVLKGVNDADAMDKKKTAERAAAYASLNTLVTRTIAAMKSCKMAASDIDNAITKKDLIDGSNIAKMAMKRKKAHLKREITGNTEGAVLDTATKTHSVSQMAYDTRLSNFEKLIAQLETAGNYRTNHADLTLEALKTFAEKLRQANDDTNHAFDLLTNKRKERNNVLYFNEDATTTRSDLIKDELLSLEGSSGVHVKKIKEYKFTKFKDS